MKKPRKLKRGLLAGVVMVFLAAPALLYWARYTEPMSWLLGKLPDRVHRKIATIFLRQPTVSELATMQVVDPDKAARFQAEVVFPPDFDVTIFATPPAVNYPVCVAAAPEGTLYVSSDGNGSLDARPGRGRVLRLRDVDGDGRADEVKAFVPEVDSPRGLVWDQDRLYLLHPPELTEYVDHNGDGVVDDQRTLVKGIGFPLSQRPGDHTANGLTLGIDGWLYAAIGDFGFLEAEGTDGRRLQLRGGGIVRVRTDGTGLELWARGTRNVFEVAVSPTLEVFGRDNSGDDGWNVWLHHFSGLTEHGWPFRYRNFAEERVAALADYGGGSGAGAAWLDEPTVPASWNDALLTADWGRERVYRHGLLPHGATHTATQEEFCTVPRVTDLDVDANGAVYVSSWRGASFMWVGREVGFVVRAAPKGATAVKIPDPARADEATLLGELGSGSHRRRLAAQRALLRRGVSPSALRSLGAMAADPLRPMKVRVAAVFTLSQALGANADAALAPLARDQDLAPWVIRAWAETPSAPSTAARAILRGGLRAQSPRLRLESVVAAGRSGDRSLGPELIALLRDADPVIAHASVRTLAALGAWRECLAAMDQNSGDAEDFVAVCRVLREFPLPEVVEGLLEKLSVHRNSPALPALLGALARLAKVEARWEGASWGTRPDTRGPFFKAEAWSHTERILGALQKEVTCASSEQLSGICREISRNRLEEVDLLGLLEQRAANELPVLGVLVSHLTASESLSPSTAPLLKRAVALPALEAGHRAKALAGLARVAGAADWETILVHWPAVELALPSADERAALRRAVLQAERLPLALDPALAFASRLSAESSKVAEAVLLKLASLRLGADSATTAQAGRSLEAGWADSRRRLQILAAAAWSGDTSRAADFISAADSRDAELAAAARAALATLGIDPKAFRSEMTGPRVSDLSEARVLEAVVSITGDAGSGAQLFQQSGCVACHTVSKQDPLKGPVLAGIASIYRRRELAEAILVPNRTLAQGFSASRFVLRNGEEIEGFIVRESPSEIVVRTINAVEHTLSTKEVARRVAVNQSLMPDGLVASLSVNQFASLLAYLESLSDGN